VTLTGRIIALAVVIILPIIFFGFVFPTWTSQGKKNATMVTSMDACLESEKNKGHGQDHLDSIYRLCWMRAKTDASK